MSCELWRVLALQRGYARGESAGVVDPHIICELICAFWKIGHKQVCRGVSVLTIETYAIAVQWFWHLLYRFKAGGTVIGYGHILHIAINVYCKGDLDFVTDFQ